MENLISVMLPFILKAVSIDTNVQLTAGTHPEIKLLPLSPALCHVPGVVTVQLFGGRSRE